MGDPARRASEGGNLYLGSPDQSGRLRKVPQDQTCLVSDGLET